MSTTTATAPGTEPVPTPGAKAANWRQRNGARIATRREDKGYNQSELAYRCGVTQQSISRVERGQADPRWWLKDRLAAALDTTVDELFGQAVERVEG